MSQSHVYRFLTSETMEPTKVALYVVSTLLLAVVIHIATRITQLIRKRNRDLVALKDFPGPPAHWLYGNLKDMRAGGDDNIMKYQAKMAADFKLACTFMLIPTIPQLRMMHPDSIKLIMNSEPKDPFTYRFLEPWIGRGLLVSNGSAWARNRRLLTPAFHFEILKPYVTVFSQSANTMVAKWRRMLNGEQQSMEMFEHVSLMTLDSLMKCIFGFKGDCQVEGFKHPYIKGVYELSEMITERFRFFPYHNDVIYHLSRSGFRFRRACRTVHKYSREVIQSKKAEKLAENGKKPTSRYLDFLDILIDARDEDGKGLSDAEIQQEVDTFMFEGHDTTASGISWCLYNLAAHPEYQEKCRAEVNNLLGDRQDFEWDDMSKMPFLNMCVKESLRITPPVPNVARQTTKPITFPDGRTVPENIWVGISIYGCHHNPEVWEEPEVYDPYRFTEENSAKRSPHAFIPFSAGARNCIGQHFALHEIRTSVALVLRNFRLTVDTSRPPVKIPLLVLRSKGGLWLHLEPIATPGE